ncbi:Kelch repeat-containing protein [Aminipila terrae]|uniref:Uncharacterized protein n=1 Tax=Aminipila terrae TaxID=2697030 RepID=A0A6P1MDU4_9FIRM|nr:kelch repeat-containing protein [Aminipila terrae]QHI72001.1 hypothetical protein Ami3637_05955 [Aminipila terrae]
MKQFIAIIMTLCLVLGVSSVSAWADDKATWQKEPSLPASGSGQGACTIGNKIYVVGGGSNTVKIYDLNTKKWTTGAPIPTARHYMGVAVDGQYIYAIGGFSVENWTYSNIVEIYDTVKNEWTTGPLCRWQKLHQLQL